MISVAYVKAMGRRTHVGLCSMKKFLILAVVSLVAIATPVMVHAEEINPTPGTYSAGSTSESSPYATLDGQPTPTPSPTPSQNDLTDTGINLVLPGIVAFILVASAGFIFFKKQRRHTYKARH